MTRLCGPRLRIRLAVNCIAVTAKETANTLNVSFACDAANRLTGVTLPGGSSATPVTLDANGNTLADSSGRAFTWDPENRMTACTLPGGQTTTFTYGADGLRRSMTTTANGETVTTDFVYDGTTLVRAMQVSNGTNFPGAPVGTLVDTDTYFQGFQGPAYHRDDATGGVPHWYVYNGLGSVGQSRWTRRATTRQAENTVCADMR